MCDRTQGTTRRALLASLPVALMTGLAPRFALANATPVDLPPPGPRDTCPVCGMFVQPYPDWTAALKWDDGAMVYFDGAKDFFKYILDLERYAPGKTRDQIAAMGVTEYYGVTMVDPTTTPFAIGSDVLGPMGHELIPFDTDADVTDFMRDHVGKKLVQFDEVTLEIVTGLDKGVFE